MTQNSNGFELTPDGAWLVVGDGPELLVYAGRTGAPHWKVFCDDILVGIGSTQQDIVALDASAHLTFYRSHDGQVIQSFSVDPHGKWLDMAEDGRVLLGSVDGVGIYNRSGQIGQVEMSGIEHGVFSKTGPWLGVIDQSGVFSCINSQTDEVLGQCNFGEPIRSIGYSSLGFWIVGLTDRIALVQNEGGEVMLTVPAKFSDLRQVVCSPDGVITAVQDGEFLVHVIELGAMTSLGSVTLRRPIVGVGLSNGPILGIGLDDGDANTLDLVMGAVLRTEPHPGRGRNNWNMKSDIRCSEVRGAVARARSGGKAIATFAGRKKLKKPRSKWWWVGIAAAGCLSLLICTGVVSALYYWFRLRG